MIDTSHVRDKTAIGLFFEGMYCCLSDFSMGQKLDSA